MKRAPWLLLSGLLAAACSDSGQERVSVPLYVAGSDVNEPVVAVGDVPVVIERAALAFGPLYLCAGATAGELCDTARLEWLEATVIDTNDPSVVRAGVLQGVTGQVNSWMYDLGISSQLTSIEPFVHGAARDLGGVSFVLEGRANVAGSELPFRASIAVAQSDDTELGVPVIRKSASAAFSRNVTNGERGLLVRFDPRPWLRRVDFRPYAADPACAQACEPLVIGPDSEAFRTLRNALVSGERPTFEWDFAP